MDPYRIKNPYGYGNSDICLRSQEVKSVYKCTTVLVTRPSTIFEELTQYKLF